MKKLMIVIALLALSGCARNVDDVKRHAASRFQEMGFTVVGYEGYNWTPAGGCVWYTLRRIPDNGVVYDGCLVKWGGEYHLYNLTAYGTITSK